MDFMNFLVIAFFFLFVISFIKERTRKFSILRIQEAERYFNSSIDNKNKHYKSRCYKYGIALAKDSKTGKYHFYKQAKMCDTALQY